MSKNWFVIVNPTSGNGASKKKWPLISNELKKQQFNFDFTVTKHKNHAIEIVQKALLQGYKKIICVGGDGTLHTVVNGILSLNTVNINEIIIGVIPIGTGNDWVKNYNIPKNYKKAIEVIKLKKTIHQDIGKITFNETKINIYFNNLAGIGFDGYVVNKVHKYKNLGFLAYLIGALVSITTYKKTMLSISFNNTVIKQKTLLALIGICKYSGGGMQLTNKPNPTDGLFDISIVYTISLINILANLKGLFNGKITNQKFVSNYKTSVIKIEILDTQNTYIQADGEVINTANFTINIVPKALQFIIA